MKVIKNISIPLSLNRGSKELLYENKEELLEQYEHELISNSDLYKAVIDLEKDKKVIGWIKAYSFDEGEGDYDFIPVYKNDTLEVVHDNVKIYKEFIIITSSEGDFRNKMFKIDGGETEGFLKFKDF